MFGLVEISEAICVLMFSEVPVDYTIDASAYLKDFYSLMLLSYNLNNQVDDEGRGWTVRNGKLFYNRNSKAA